MDLYEIRVYAPIAQFCEKICMKEATMIIQRVG